MRIIAGRYRGTRLCEPPSGNRRVSRPGPAPLRPTADRVRENIFNLLVNGRLGDRVTGRHVLDLFAGTGALGLEALSRGAASVHFVDNDSAARTVIERNIGRLRADGVATLNRCDATSLGRCPGRPFDLVFADPPYRRGLGVRALLSAAEGGWLARDTVAVWEDGERQSVPDGFETHDVRRYGGSVIHVLRWRQREALPCGA
ncbi:MAG: 16S rRNA (guanine(966)-N(2))-methyltransferase RsmD [Paracoccaceae bacterium]|nr:16S rRNA (guanine(966)-N(2))-methyltransferase RsmD [Paracoccaceae bacterium]MDE2914737.1 16S rRNA (guanine(966)-N(2))-methyltransferase RsmD [Paracoccaceae bacterium]